LVDAAIAAPFVTKPYTAAPDWVCLALCRWERLKLWQLNGQDSSCLSRSPALEVNPPWSSPSSTLIALLSSTWKQHPGTVSLAPAYCALSDPKRRSPRRLDHWWQPAFVSVPSKAPPHARPPRRVIVPSKFDWRYPTTHTTNLQPQRDTGLCISTVSRPTVPIFRTSPTSRTNVRSRSPARLHRGFQKQ
jgi:hypothetical protein